MPDDDKQLPTPTPNLNEAVLVSDPVVTMPVGSENYTVRVTPLGIAQPPVQLPEPPVDLEALAHRLAAQAHDAPGGQRPDPLETHAAMFGGVALHSADRDPEPASESLIAAAAKSQPPSTLGSDDMFFDQLHMVIVPEQGNVLELGDAQMLMDEWLRAASSALARVPAQRAAIEADQLLLEQRARFARLVAPRTGTSLDELMRLASAIDGIAGNGTEVDLPAPPMAADDDRPGYVNRDGTINQR